MTARLYTQCRGCGEVFPLSTEALTCAYGRVRCSVCGTVFNALDTLTDRLIEGDLPLHDTDNAPPLLQHPDEPDEPDDITHDITAETNAHLTRDPSDINLVENTHNRQRVIELPHDNAAGAATEHPHAPVATPEEALSHASDASMETGAEPARQDHLARDAIHDDFSLPDTPENGPDNNPDADPAQAGLTYAPAEMPTGYGLSHPHSASHDAAAPQTTADLFEPLAESDNPSMDGLHPDFGHSATRPTQHWSRLWSLGTLALVLVLLWQLGLGIQKGAIVLPEATWANTLCEKLHCPSQTAKPLALDRIASISSSIRPHPGREDALIISTTFMNTAKQPMPFPALQVTLSDLDGKTVAMRRFLPEEYLPENLRNGPMLPQTLIPVTLEILKPEGQANAFQIDFSQPGGASHT